MYNFHKVRSNSNENCFIHEKFVKNDLYFKIYLENQLKTLNVSQKERKRNLKMIQSAVKNKNQYLMS